MLQFVYDILLILAVPLLVPYLLYRRIFLGKRRKGVAERLGFFSREKTEALEGGDPIWIHAASVGETLAVRPLLTALKKKYPRRKIVLSTVTETGRGIAEKLVDADLLIYFPFDVRFAVRSVLSKIHPSLIVIVETEIWPNLLRFAGQRNIPVVLANGRISDKSFNGYLRFSWFFKPILENFSAFCMQTEEDACRIIAIGAPRQRVHVTKNLKYDIPIRKIEKSEKDGLRMKYRLPEKASILVAGSTHRGEEEQVLAAYRTLVDEKRDIALVLVPRHPERADEVGALLDRFCIKFVRRSALPECPCPVIPGDVLLVDTVGELMNLYSIADLVFVGGSLVPVGGHNLLEPASLGVPVLFGPYMNNFKEIVGLILGYGGGVQVADLQSMIRELRNLLDDPRGRARMGEQGVRLFSDNSGSTERHLEIIDVLLEPSNY